MRGLRGWMRVAVIGTATVLAACGGGGDDDDDDAPSTPVGPGWAAPPTPPTAPANGATVDGVFRDGPVQGLNYSSTGLQGTTDVNGRFQYAQGSAVTFTIGGVTLGSLTGQPYMSPLHMPTSATNLAQQITNRARFLQALDVDSNPENGIVISPAVSTLAAGWTTPDFSLSYSAFTTAITPLIAAASTADGTTKTIPNETAAADHFSRNAWCTYNGIYRGTFTGSGDNGVWAVVVYGVGGLIFGGAYSNVDRAGFELQKQTATGLSIFPAFTTGQVSNGATFSGTFGTPDRMSGTWSSPPDTGTFTGARSFGTTTARYRISGYQFPLGTALLISFEIDANNQVTGQIIDRDYFRTAEPVALTGMLNGTTFTAAAAGNVYSLTGTFNTSSLQLTGTLQDNVKSRSVTLNLAGCRLN